MKPLTFLFSILITIATTAQDKRYYYQIPEEPASYTAETVAARLGRWSWVPVFLGN